MAAAAAMLVTAAAAATSVRRDETSMFEPTGTYLSKPLPYTSMVDSNAFLISVGAFVTAADTASTCS